MIKQLAAVALAVAAIVAPTHGAAAAAAAKNVAAPVAAPVAVTESVNTHLAAVAMADRVWLAETLADAGVVVPATVTVIITDVDNCGSKLGPTGTGGGCTVRFHDGTISVLVSQSAIDNGTGEHILFHELGHALHNLGECEAEYYAHQYSNPALWSYASCKR